MLAGAEAQFPKRSPTEFLTTWSAEYFGSIESDDASNGGNTLKIHNGSLDFTDFQARTKQEQLSSTSLYKIPNRFLLSAACTRSFSSACASLPLAIIVAR